MPAIGSKVLFTYQDDDGLHPIYIGSVATEDVLVQELLEDYPDAWGFIDKGGNKFFVNEKKSTALWVHVSGSSILFKEDGSVDLLVAKDLNQHVNGNFTLAVKGDIKIGSEGKMNVDAGGNIDMRGSRIDFNKGGANPPEVTAAQAREKPQATYDKDSEY